tara:strand:+ start:621 stop:737 length:117 start_codon:yes stop_codon:yes gene_type:complete
VAVAEAVELRQEQVMQAVQAALVSLLSHTLAHKYLTVV